MKIVRWLSNLYRAVKDYTSKSKKTPSSESTYDLYKEELDAYKRANTLLAGEMIASFNAETVATLFADAVATGRTGELRVTLSVWTAVALERNEELLGRIREMSEELIEKAEMTYGKNSIVYHEAKETADKIRDCNSAYEAVEIYRRTLSRIEDLVLSGV